MTRLRFLRTALLACALTACAVGAQAQQYYDNNGAAPADASTPDSDSAQTPGRVARLAYTIGQVQFAPAGDDSWGSVDVNRPMVIGDRLLTGDDGRAALELGDASVRIDHGSAFDFLNLDQGNVQLELSQGTLNIAVRQLDQGENFEVDTPTVAFVAATPGVYRIDDNPDGTGSMVTVFQGSGTVYGENGASRNVVAGTSYRFNDSSLASVDENGLPQSDDFDRFCESRDNNYRRYADQQQQYVPSDMIGADDLAEYGSWDQEPEYGAVWYPRSVPTGWAPYRYGHWAWIEPWGWTWVDDQRWGFAPFHYGRWVYAGNRWGWIPGPVHVRPVYAPALVAFVGGAGFSLSVNLGGGRGPVGWFPLGPRDVYTPWFHASRNYFTQVNVTNIRNVYVNKTVINNYYVDYHAGRAPRYTGHDYAYRALPNAVTAVPSSVFTGARPVHQAILHLDRNQLERAQVAVRPVGATPSQTSLGLRAASTRPEFIKARGAFQQQVVARHAPPPRPVSFAAQQKLIAAQDGRPLAPAQLQTLRQQRPTPAAETNSRVRLVAPPRAGLSGRPTAVAPAPAEHGFHNQIHPIPARVQPQSSQPGALPSSGFRHPQPTVIQPRPASEPVNPAQLRNPHPVMEPRPANTSARPIEQPQQQREQQLEQQRAAQQQREQQMEQQRAAQQQREQAMQQQRQVQMQQREQQMAQQRAAQQQREQQIEQQRAAQQQQQAEMQQQRQTEMQQRQQQMEQQRAQQQQREQAMQQQRQMQMQQRAQEAQQRQQQVHAQPQREPADSGHHKPPPSSDERYR